MINDDSRLRLSFGGQSVAHDSHETTYGEWKRDNADSDLAAGEPVEIRRQSRMDGGHGGSYLGPISLLLTGETAVIGGGAAETVYILRLT
jgi:hypothetical protein